MHPWSHLPQRHAAIRPFSTLFARLHKIDRLSCGFRFSSIFCQVCTQSTWAHEHALSCSIHKFKKKKPFKGTLSCVLVPLILRFLRVGTMSVSIPGLPEIVLISAALCLIDTSDAIQLGSSSCHKWSLINLLAFLFFFFYFWVSLCLILDHSEFLPYMVRAPLQTLPKWNVMIIEKWIMERKLGELVC